MAEFVSNDVVSATSDDIGKLKNKISILQYRVRRMTSADTSKPNSNPWKPEVTPPRRTGGNFRSKGGRQHDSGRQTNNNSGSNNSNKSFGNRGQNSGNQRNRGRGRGRFDTSPSVRRPRVASKTIDQDKGRCFYCNVRSALRKLRLKNPEGSAEWIQIPTRMASIQIMMILALIKIKVPFGEKLSGRIMTKLFGNENVFTMKLKIENYQGCVQFINKG